MDVGVALIDQLGLDGFVWVPSGTRERRGRKPPYGVEKRFDVSSQREHGKELRRPHRDEDPGAPWDQRAQHSHAIDDSSLESPLSSWKSSNRSVSAQESPGTLRGDHLLSYGGKACACAEELTIHRRKNNMFTGAAVGGGVVGLQLVWLLLFGAQAAAIVLQAVRLGLEALGLRAVQIHGAAAHGHLGLGHVAVVVLADGQRVAVLRPVAVGQVGVARRPEVDAARQAAVVVRQVGVAVVEAVVAHVLALGRLPVRVVVGVVVGARQGGGGLRGDEAVASVLHVAAVDGVGVAAQRGRAFGEGQAVGPQGHLAHRPRGHRLHHLGHLQRGTGAPVRQCGLCMAGGCSLPAAHMQQHALH
ncbi:hypothetical protein EYF80_013441 [Liparis tanakae]|uniref:Uncharacterized protein n=1 Tax=Liparis tanakae TaxID=230148 RepID=A0A4Z2IGE5_9TELE|nr:hypothetical protein EYF80_013441 [Liparis tanakae]